MGGSYLGCVDTGSVQFGSIWIGFTIARVLPNCVGLHGLSTTLE